MRTRHQSKDQIMDMTKMALVASLYIVLTLAVAPVAFGPIQFRISEILNFLGLHNRRYLYGLTLGAVIVNMYQFGLIDMVIGGASTFVFIALSGYIGDKLVEWIQPKKIDPWLIKYIVLTILFSACMFTIAGMLVIVGAESSFWPVYVSLFVSELIVLTIGLFIMYPLSQRFNFDE